MKKLNFKGVIFNSFAFMNDSDKRTFDESDIETMEGLESGGWGYICPHCIKKYGLYEETETTELKINDILNNNLNDDYTEGYICCIDGCYNMDAYEIYFSNEDCKLIE